jgi:hypothetical protein
MKTFKVPTHEEVSPANQAIFDKLEKKLGRVPVSLRASASFRRCLSVVVLEYEPINIKCRQGISQTPDICY